MAKRQKLSLQQKRRVARSQQKKLSGHESKLLDDERFGPIQQGIVISRFGEQADVADEHRRVYRCHLRQHLGSCVSGDRVKFRPEQLPASPTIENSSINSSLIESSSKESLSQIGVIEAISPRDNLLQRPTPHGGVKTVVANVDQIFVVISPLPEYSSLLLDRYLVACELSNISATIVLNKTDLLTEKQQAYFSEELNRYQAIGYPCLKVNTQDSANGQSELLAAMSGKENILVGQSGVGKSSLINCLLPDVRADTQEISLNSKLGTHTTTASRLYFLPEGGHLIDSPGVREFGLWHLEPERLIEGFKELYPLSNDCKFRNCRHLNEKGCAVIHPSNPADSASARIKNYQKIYQQLLQQASR